MFYNAEQAYTAARKIHEKAMLRYPDSLVIAPPDDAKAKYDRAIEKSAKVLEIFPKDKKWHPAAYFLMGKSYFYEEEINKSIRWLRQLQQEYPGSPFIPESYVYIGMDYVQNDELDKAEDVLKSTLAKYPELDKDQKISFLLVEIETRREGKARAIQRLEKVRTTVKSPDKQRELLFRVAEMNMDLQQYQAAIDLLQKAPNLKKFPDQEYRRNCDLVACYAAIDSFKAAIGILDRMEVVKRFADHNREIVYNRGMIYEQMDSIGAAISSYKDVIGPTDSATLQTDTSQMIGKALFRLGLIYQKRKQDYKQAQFCFTSIVDRKGRDSAVSLQATTRMKAIRRIHILRDLLSGKLKPGQDTIPTATTVAFNADSLKRDSLRLDTLRRKDSLRLDTLRHKKGVSADSLKRDSLRLDSLRHKGLKVDSLMHDTLQKNYKTMPASKPDSAKPAAAVVKISRPDTLYKIGELFYYDLDEPDSAITAFLKLAADSSADSVFGPKALCAAAFIAKSSLDDTARSDTLYQLVVKRYPDGEFAHKALIEMHAIPDSEVTTRKEKAQEAYLAAERKYREEGDIRGAVLAFFNIYKTYPDLAIASKSLYASAWLTDNELGKKVEAKKLYERICARYPNSDYCTKEAKPRVQTALDTLNAYGQLARTAEKAGKTAPAGEKKPDSAAHAAADTGSPVASTPAAHATMDTGSSGKTAPAAITESHAPQPDSSKKPAVTASYPKNSEEPSAGAQPQKQPGADSAALKTKSTGSASDSASTPKSPTSSGQKTGKTIDSTASHAGDLTGQTAPAIRPGN